MIAEEIAIELSRLYRAVIAKLQSEQLGELFEDTP